MGTMHYFRMWIFILVATGSLAVVLFPIQVSAVTCPDAVNWRIVGGVCVPTTAGSGLSSASVVDVTKGVMNWLLGIFGFISVIAFVVSGIQYLTAAGDDDMISTAKRNMKYSIIGVIVALSGFVIFRAVQSAFTATNATF